MATRRAYIYKEGLFFKVYPPVVLLTGNDKFQLVNTTGQDASWTIPKGDPFLGGPVTDEPVPAHGKSGEKEKKNNNIVSVEYNVLVGGFPAIANSDPVIIIDP